MDEMPRLKEVLGEAGARIGIDRAAEAGALWARWEAIVGDVIAEHAEPTSLRRGVLKIRATSAAWATEIGYLKERIISASNAALGGNVVVDVKVWTSSEPIRRRRAKRAPSEPVPSSSEDSGEAPQREPEEALARARAAWSRHRPGTSPRGPR